MKNKLSTIILVILFVAGLSLLLYPTISDYWNSRHASQAISDYTQEVKNLNADEYDNMLQAAQDYNETLQSRINNYALTDNQKKMYESLLNLNGTGIMGYIEIPSINVSLPIYHGTEDSVLQVAVGHLEWASLPVGGESTHCVLSGHRGLPSAKLFTNLDKLIEGDIFIIRVLDEIYTYEVDRILIVEPEEVSALNIEEGEDLCTLVTCTPYGINSHRLLVRGHRVENIQKSQTIRVTSDAIRIEPIIVAPVIAAPILFILLLSVLLSGGRKKRNGGKENEKDE